MKALLLALAASLAVNAGLVYAGLQLRDQLTSAKKDLAIVGDAATSCSDSVDKLATDAKKRAKAAAPLTIAAASSAAALDKRADEILSTPASTPGDACKSAQDRVDALLKDRS